ncbi:MULTISPECIES: hypothetical protein [unclassified Streptomyces]|uniref:hypothetical protein n=1 Tax=unclassified Streptomyces TaxID=2593676 RepID=UPI00131BEDA6|nr:hypothetical protein [Streptomyces sp. CB01635]
MATKLVDRWLTALVAPGLLWLVVLAAATRLEQSAPFRFGPLGDWLDRLSGIPALHTPAVVVLVAVAAMLAGGVVGQVASVLGGVVERCWAIPGALPPATWLLAARRRRWDRATRRLREAILRAAELDAQQTDAMALRRHRQRDRLGPGRALRPTRIGDRYARTAERVRCVNGLDDLALVWPRLWIVLPDPLRAEVAAARDSTSDAARLSGWGVLYLTISACWWPCALVGACLVVVSVLRARSTGENLAVLIETAVDLHSKDLTERLGLPPAESTVAAGHAITARLVGAPGSQDGTVTD